MITLILSHDEAQKIGRHILNGNPYIFTNTRFSDDGGTFEKDLELLFIEDDCGMCKVCGNFIEECGCNV